MNSVWTVRIVVGGMMIAVLAIMVPALARMAKPENLQTKFIKMIHKDYPNKIGDIDFVCEDWIAEMNTCNTRGKFIGFQTHDVYLNAGYALAGMPSGARAQFVRSGK